MKLIENTVAAVFASIAIGSVLALTLSAFIPQPPPKVDGLAQYLPEIATVAHDTATAAPVAPAASLLSYLTN